MDVETRNNIDTMTRTAEALVAPGKGLLAADESTPTIAKRLASVGLESTEPLRRAYRGLLFETEGLSRFISGVILFDETIRQRTDDGTPMADLLHRQGILPGIKVNAGTRPLAGFPEEEITEGLDGLRDRLAEYAALGARFAKWRAVIRIGDGRPSATCIEANAHALARYAALAQEAGLTPIVEPEVLTDGTHDIDRCAEVTVALLRAVFAQLARHRVVLEASLLKPSMVTSGRECPERAGVDQVASATLAALRRTVPAAVPGIVFLSGGQSAEQACTHLTAINRHGDQPWELSFSFGRALQAPVLHTWAGFESNREAAQEALLRRAELTSAGRTGAYHPEMERLVTTI